MKLASSNLVLLDNPPGSSPIRQMNGTMRITFLLPPVNLSGGIRVIAIYAERLRQRGHEVNVISVSHGRPSLRQSMRMLIREGKLPAKPKPMPSYFDDLPVAHQLLPHSGPVCDSDVPDGDVVIATWWQTMEWLAELSPSKGVQVHFMQDYEIWGGPPDQIEAVHRLPIPRIVLTRWMADLMREKYGQEPIALIPNSVDREVFHAPARRKQSVPTVGLVYAEKPYKGTDICIQAIEIARRQIPNLKVLSMGNNPPTPELPLPAGTEFTLQARDQELRQIYSSCDVWLFGTRVEGFGLPILEAMACRTPVIGTPAGAAPDLLSQGGGIMVPMEDPQAMAQAIVDVCGMNEEEWKGLSDRAVQTVASYTWEDATDRFEAALRQLVASDAA